ncbi:MAG: prolyl-tRNA synthetase associated domain-containing protein [Gemmatimonadales bacterium]
MTDAELCAFLDDRGIAYRRVDHPAVFTCDEADRLVPAEAVGVQTKNLFLRDKKGRRHWLVVTTCAKPVDLKALAPLIGADNLSLGSPDRLARHLGVTPGAVTLLALVNDPSHAVSLVIDREIWEVDHWRCHPLVNTATLSMPWASVQAFLAAVGHPPETVVVPARAG